MARIVVNNLVSGGAIRDVVPWDLPPEVFSRVENMRLTDGALASVDGYSQVFDPPTVDPIWLLPVRTNTEYFWLYTSLLKAYCVNTSNTHTNITRTVGGDYTGDITIGWTGGVLNSIPVINNGADVPQMWNPAAAATPLSPLTDWPAGYICRTLRTFKNYLIALDITKSGTRYAQLVLWSHAADPGDVPSSWDVTDPTVDAGEFPLSETMAACVECLPLRDFNVVYKEDQAWLMQYVGGLSIFAFRRIRASTGILGRRCAGAFELEGRGEHHFVVGPDDIYVHNGQYAQSVIDEKNRRTLYGELNTSALGVVHVTVNNKYNEIYVMYPTSGNTYCNRCAIWDWKKDKWTFRDVPNISYSTVGIISPSLASDAWSAAVGDWASDSAVWDEQQYSTLINGVMMGMPGSSRKLFKLNDGSSANGTTITASAERSGLAVIGQDRAGKPIVDTNIRKLVKEIWPRVSAPSGAIINIYVGKQDNLNAAVTWYGPYPYVCGTDDYVKPLVEGRFIAVRFEGPCTYQWKLHGYDMELEPTGEY